MVRRSIFVLGVCGVFGWMGGDGVSAATCEGRGRFVGGKPTNGKGFKQAVTVAVAAKCGAPCHGLVTYSVHWRDKAGAQQISTGKTVKYAFVPGQGTASVGSGGGAQVTDSTVLEARPGATRTLESDRRDGRRGQLFQGRWSWLRQVRSSGSFVSSAPTDAKGFEQDVHFSVSSDAGSASHGLVKYTLQWTDRAGLRRRARRASPTRVSRAAVGATRSKSWTTRFSAPGLAPTARRISSPVVRLRRCSCFLDK